MQSYKRIFQIYNNHQIIMGQRINELIIHVKQHINLNEKQTQKSVSEIENQIDDKTMEIRQIFSRNLSSVITHYIKYQEISSNQRKLENHCEQFSKRIEKAQNLSLYDQQMIQRGEKAIGALKEKRRELQIFRVRFLKKAALNIQEQRYSNGIKQLNLYRQKEPTIDTPLKKANKIFNDRIKSHLIKLINNFWEINKAKIVDIGCHCYNKVELSTNQKTNIYHAFFGRNSMVRNSLIRKSTIVDEGRNEAPLRFLKKIKDEQILQKFILRLNLQMNSLKQAKMICKEMREEQLFKELLNKQIRKNISDISKQIICESDADLRKLLCHYIGFLLFRRQVIAFFLIEGENKIALGQIYTLIGQQAKSLITKPQNISQILQIKGMLDIFRKVLEIIDLDEKSSQYSIVLMQIFKIYCSFSLEQYESIINEQINQDNLMGYVPQNDAQEKLIDQILKVKTPLANQTYNFTKFVMYVLHIFTQYYDRMVAFVKDSELNKSQLHDHLSNLFQRIIAVYGGLLVVKDHPLHIAQGEINLHYCEVSFLHFSHQLQIKHDYIRVTEFSYKAKLETVIVELRRRIRQILEQKITVIMSNYEQNSSWFPDNVNQQPHDFIEWTFQYIKSVVSQLRRTNNPGHEQITYSLISYVSQLYWEYFQQCKEYNLLTIYNLDMDLMFIYKYITKNFGFYSQLNNKFKGLGQFYSFLLTNNIQDILDRQKRDITYSHLDLNRIIPILKKYNKAKHNAGGKIRDLKKKDIQVIVKKLEGS